MMSESKQQGHASGLPVEVNHESRFYLLETAKWAKFLAIVFFVYIGFLALAGLTMIFCSSSLFMSGTFGALNSGPMTGMGAMLYVSMGVFYLIIALLYFLPTLYLYRFATNTKRALAAGDSNELTRAFHEQKKAYRFMGILTIIMLAVIVLSVVVGLLGAITAGVL